MERIMKNDGYLSETLEFDRNGEGLSRFQIRPNLKLVLFTSHTPCEKFSQE